MPLVDEVMSDRVTHVQKQNISYALAEELAPEGSESETKCMKFPIGTIMFTFRF